MALTALQIRKRASNYNLLFGIIYLELFITTIIAPFTESMTLRLCVLVLLLFNVLLAIYKNPFNITSEKEFGDDTSHFNFFGTMIVCRLFLWIWFLVNIPRYVQDFYQKTIDDVTNLLVF